VADASRRQRLQRQQSNYLFSSYLCRPVCGWLATRGLMNVAACTWICVSADCKIAGMTGSKRASVSLQAITNAKAVPFLSLALRTHKPSHHTAKLQAASREHDGVLNIVCVCITNVTI